MSFCPLAALVTVTHGTGVCGDRFRGTSTAGHHRRLLLPGFCGISAAPGRCWITEGSLRSVRPLQERAQGVFGAQEPALPEAGRERSCGGQLVPAHREDGADGPLSSLKLLAVLQPFGSCFGGFSGAPSPADTVGPPPAAQLCGGTLFFLLAVLYHERVTAP